MYSSEKREKVNNKKFIHTQDHLNKQVVIQLVFLQFFIHIPTQDS